MRDGEAVALHIGLQIDGRELSRDLNTVSVPDALKRDPHVFLQAVGMSS